MIVEIFFQVGNAMKILIRGGRLIDPANSIDSVHDLLLQDGRVAAIDPAEAAADVTIDAAGKVVCPGFIDIHMHEDPVLEDGTIDNDLETAIQNTMLRMGVTTAVAGNCGEVKYHPADYLDLVDKQGTAVNIAMMAGHEYFRVKSGCTDKYGPATEAQKAQMAAELEECLLRGCLGISYGIRYVPGLDRDELLQTAAGCRVTGGVLAAHIRDDAEAVFAAAEEFIDIGRTLSLPMEISHIGSMAGFGQMERFLRQVDHCKAEGLKIGCDCYPYDAFSTDLGSTTYDDGWRDRYGCGYDVVELCEGKYKGQRCTKEIFDEVRRDFPACKTICYVMMQEEVDLAFRHPGVMLGSDGTLSSGQGHPRAAGAFPRLIARYAKKGVISLYEAVNKMTAMPANHLGLSRKGRLNVGADADVVIFDPETIEDRATFAEPLLAPKGIDYVIVNGKIAARDGSIVCRNAGKSVRKI